MFKSKIFLAIGSITSTLFILPSIVSCSWLQIPSIEDARIIEQDNKYNLVIIGKNLEIIRKIANEVEIVEKDTNNVIEGWSAIDFPSEGFSSFPEATKENSLVIALDQSLAQIDLSKNYSIRIKKFPNIKFDIPNLEGKLKI